MAGFRELTPDTSSWHAHRRLLLLATAGGWSVPKAQMRTPAIHSVRSRRIRLIVNDIESQIVPSSTPFRIVTCKEIASIRNAYAGLTNKQVLQTTEFDLIYQKIKARHTELAQTAATELASLQTKLNTASDRDRKLAIAAYIPIGLAAVVFIAGILPALGAGTIASMYLLGSVTLFKLGFGTYQLFQINDSEGLQDTLGTIASFNDAKLGTISLISDSIGDISGAEQIVRFNAKTWGAVSNLFDLYTIAQYLTNDALVRIKGLTDLAMLNLNVLNAEANSFLANKQAFAEYIRLSSGIAAQSAERIWQAASLNDCAIHGTLPLSRVFEAHSAGPTLRSKP